MTRALWLAVGVLCFALVGTANSGGYRFGASDQAFYIPAVALRADPGLFPRDREVFEPQMRLWLGDEMVGALVRTTGIELPMLFALLQGLTLTLLAAGAIALARTLGCDWWTIAACLILLTLRHRIAKTGVNSLEGYMHPRMLAFATGLIALTCIVRLRHATAGAWTIAAGLVHTSTAIWFAGVVMVAACWQHRRHRRLRGMVASTAVTIAIATVWLLVTHRLPVMDATWLSAIGDRDYLFPAEWPLYAWASNLAYPVVLAVIYRQRVARGRVVAGEPGLVAGLIAMVAVFLITVPLAQKHVAFFVQLQANRVFWLLDAAVALYLSWWMMQKLSGRRAAWIRPVALALLAAVAVGRGAYVLRETSRPLVQLQPVTDDWMRVAHWLRAQPRSWHVLADPGHAWKYGVSLRAAAWRDTLLEAGKDPAMAMYDRQLAVRVAERAIALRDFDTWTLDDVRRVAARYDLQVFVDRTDRRFDLPVLFRTDTFVVYDLR